MFSSMRFDNLNSCESLTPVAAIVSDLSDSVRLYFVMPSHIKQSGMGSTIDNFSWSSRV